MKKFIYLLILCFFAFSLVVESQEAKKPISELSQDEILSLTYEQLLNLPFEDLVSVANKFGLSAEEFLDKILNKEIVSASKKSEKSLEAPLSTTVISKDEIQNSGATTIEEALRLAPGLIVRQKTNGNFDVHIRGNDNVPPNEMLLYSENTTTLVMIDNRPIFNYGFGGSMWETFPVDLIDIERIEIIRGPSTALYGPNAMSGVINIITKKVDSKKPKINADIQAGNFNTKIVNASSSIGVNKFKFKLSTNYQYFERSQSDFYTWVMKKYMNINDILAIPNSMNPAESLEKDVNIRILRPQLGRERFGLNGFIFYDLSKDINFSIIASSQKSNVVTNVFGRHEIPMTGRVSETQSVDFKAKVYGFELQSSYAWGAQDYERKNPGFKLYEKIFNSSAEYNYIYKNLTIRPGVSLQLYKYDDRSYVNESIREGFLNKEAELNILAYYLRLDYIAFKKLRFIAAIRGDKFNEPNINKFTYQFISTYKVNETNLIRGVYSRANRSPFLTDVYANYNWVYVPALNINFDYIGNKNYKLATMDMYELGYRTKPLKNIQVDLEAYYSKSKDFGMYSPDSLSLMKNPVTQMLIIGADGNPIPQYARFKYTNLDIKSIQKGVTLSVSWALNENIQIKAFGTMQETKLENYSVFNSVNRLKLLTINAVKNGTIMAMQGQIPKWSATQFKDSTINTFNTATPAFYGGLCATYIYNKKLNFTPSLYFYGKQTFKNMNNNNNESQVIKAKTIVNLKVSFKFWRENSIYVNLRNLISKEREFAFMDDIEAMYLVGLNLNF